MINVRIAVLLSGSPRFVKEGSEWWHIKSMPKNATIDYYGHSWDAHDHIGKTRYYNADNKVINYEYFKCWNFTDFLLTPYSVDIPEFETIKNSNSPIANFFLWNDRRDHILSVIKANELLVKSKKQYDIVIVMRYDTIIYQDSLDKAIPFILDFKNSHTSKFHRGYDKALYWNGNNPTIFTPWVQVRQGLPVMQDYMFISTYNDWATYSYNLKEKYHNLLNKDIKILEPLHHVVTEATYIPHVMWAFIGLYTNANFIQQDDLKVCVIRSEKNNIANMNYLDLELEHDNNFNELCEQYKKEGIKK